MSSRSNFNSSSIFSFNFSFSVSVKKELQKIVDKYQMPITNIEIFHSDGAWEFPHDMDKENHPYKYGYGKLFHSGYHFIDLLSDFIKINDSFNFVIKKVNPNWIVMIYCKNVYYVTS